MQERHDKLKGALGRPPEWWGTGFTRRGWEAGGVGLGQPGDEMASGATNSSHRACEGSLRMWNQSPHRGAGKENKIQIRISETAEFQIWGKTCLPRGYSGSGTGCSERLCSLLPWRFQDPAGQIPEQSGVIPQLILLWAGGWTRWFPLGYFQHDSMIPGITDYCQNHVNAKFLQSFSVAISSEEMAPFFLLNSHVLFS